MFLFIFKKTFNLFISRKCFSIYSIRIIATIALIIIDILSTSLIAYYFKLIINSLANNVLYSIWGTVILLGCFFILQKIMLHVQEIIFFPVINFAIKEVTYKVVSHIHKISLIDYQKLSIPELINSIRRISLGARAFIKVLFLMLIPTSIKLIIAIYILIIKMGTISLLLIPSFILAVVFFYQGTKAYVTVRDLAWKTTDQVISRINDSFINTKIIRCFNTLEMEEIKNLLNSEAKIWYKTNTTLHGLHIIIGLLLGICITIILIGVILAIQKSRLTIGDFVFLKSQLLAVWLPFKSLTVEFRQLIESLVDIKKIIQILELPQINNESNKNIIYEINENITINNINNNNKIVYLNYKHSKFKMIDDIYLDNITFAYNINKVIFKNLSFSILTGEKIGITGNIGSGKTTLIHLMSGFYHPNKGAVYLKGQDTKLISKEFLHSKIYCIHQDFKLFNASLLYNLSYGIKNCSIIQLQHFIKSLKFMNFIEQMPLGLHTIVGEKGIKLSGGEQQKIALCRALLLKPDILFVDETTNSLDLTMEKQILDLLFAHIPTVVLVSHRIYKNNYLNYSLSKVLNLDH